MRRRRHQSGYALIFLVLGLMGAGGVVLAGMTQNAREVAEERRYQHNKRVLEEAKQALLMYAYRYPQIARDYLGTVRGPGRLPCPDTDNNGLPNASFDCENAGIPLVGRFPWDADGMDFYDIRDASGERLWYAVSENFANLQAGTDIVNSDSFGTITVYDQSGTTIYDGAVDGIAAVLIAPGQPIARDDAPIDGVYEYIQVRGTVAEQADPRNYLDTFTLIDIGPPIAITHFDNSIFTNGEDDSDDDNFILGPVFNIQAGDIVMNDQAVVITTEEVVAMAEKAVLDAYRESIREYQGNIGIDRFPWLDPYESADGLATFDAVVTPAANPVIGRVPSIFSNYFAPSPGGSQTFATEVTMKFIVDGESFEAREFEPAASFNAAGDLNVPAISGQTYIAWAWDGSPSQAPTQPVDGIWELCPYVTGTEEDCNQDLAGNFIGGVTSQLWLSVRKYTITLNPITQFPIADRTGAGINYLPPTAAGHAFIEAEFDGLGYVVTIDWEEDEEFQSSHAIFPAGNIGSLTYDAGDSVIVGVRYYPTLPVWAMNAAGDNNWHNRVQMAYSVSMRPDGDGNCLVPANDCLVLNNSGGTENDKPALLVIAGTEDDGDPTDTDLVDNLNPGVFPFFRDDLGEIFEGENATPDQTFDKRAGNRSDSIIVLD